MGRRRRRKPLEQQAFEHPNRFSELQMARRGNRRDPTQSEVGGIDHMVGDLVRWYFQKRDGASRPKARAN